MNTTLDDEDLAGGAGGAVGAAAVYANASSSVVFIETPDLTTGSGIVTDDGWIITNEHVVGRFDAVRVGTSAGVDLGEHAVVATDPVLDLAVVGPVSDPGVTPIERGVSADLVVGDQIYLLGFPDESMQDPLATLTQGIVSNRRRLALGDFPFLQVDALIAPGQSGGALLDGGGRVVGISGLGFGEGNFGLVLESDVIWDRVDDMITDGDHDVGSGQPETRLSEEVGAYRAFAALVETDENGGIDIAATSDGDVWIELLSLGGGRVFDDPGEFDLFDDPPDGDDTDPYFVDATFDGTEDLEVQVDPGRYVVQIGSFSAVDEVRITSATPLRRFADVEEGRVLPVGEIVEGRLDWATDSDRWTLELAEGDEVRIVADGIADTVVAVRFDGELVGSSDDAGIGMLGTGSDLTFTAAGSGVYEVEVGTFDQDRTGYLIEVTVS